MNIHGLKQNIKKENKEKKRSWLIRLWKGKINKLRQLKGKKKK